MPRYVQDVTNIVLALVGAGGLLLAVRQDNERRRVELAEVERKREVLALRLEVKEEVAALRTELREGLQKIEPPKADVKTWWFW